MAKRTIRSTKSKAKTADTRGQVTHLRDTTRTHFAVKDVSAAPYGRPTPSAPADGRCVPATQAKNRFGEILQSARDSGPVFIERHGQAQAVVLGIDTYNKLVSNERTPEERELDYWTREFHALHARMQTKEAREAVDALFSATDAELNRRGI
jgi:prevent-host-death family protein